MRNPGALPPPPAARGYLAGAHVPGQLQAPAAVTVAGVAAGGVDAGLLTALLCALVHVCSHREPLSPQGRQSLCPHHTSAGARPSVGPQVAQAHTATQPAGSFWGHGCMLAWRPSARPGRHRMPGSRFGRRFVPRTVARVGEPGWPGGLREAGWDHLSPSSWRGSHRPQAGKWWEAVWLFGPLDMAGPGALGAGKKAAPRIQAARPISLCLWGGAGCTRDRVHVTCMVRQGPRVCRWGGATSRVCR